EAAAHFGAGQLLERQPLDGGKQLARLLLDAELAQSRTGVVIGRDAVIMRLDTFHPAHIGEEGDELVSALREMLGTLEQRRLVGEELGVMFLDHAAAGAGRHHDIVEALERIDDLARDRLGVGLVAGIVGGLATAGLHRRYLDRAAGFLEQLHGGKTDRGAEEIDEASDEQAYADGHGRVWHWRQSLQANKRLEDGQPAHGKQMQRLGAAAVAGALRVTRQALLNGLPGAVRLPASAAAALLLLAADNDGLLEVAAVLARRDLLHRARRHRAVTAGIGIVPGRHLIGRRVLERGRRAVLQRLTVGAVERGGNLRADEIAGSGDAGGLVYPGGARLAMARLPARGTGAEGGAERHGQNELMHKDLSSRMCGTAPHTRDRYPLLSCGRCRVGPSYSGWFKESIPHFRLAVADGIYGGFPDEIA